MMPCYDPPVEEMQRAHASMLESFLCAILRGSIDLEQQLAAADWEKSGTSKEALRTWWLNHQKMDALRSEYETRKRQALEKLTPEERQALGLK